MQKQSYFSHYGGFNNLLKSGYRHYKGKAQTLMKNVEAISDMAEMTRTSLGPNGMKKYIINYLDKIFLTKDANVMATELEINHPAVNVLVDALKAQNAEQGDLTNFVVTFGGELMSKAGNLVSEGVHVADVSEGYEKAFNYSMELLDKANTHKVEDVKNLTEATKIIKPVIGSKLAHGQETFLAPLIAQACINVVPTQIEKFDVDNVRVAKILGGSLMKSEVIKGMLVVRKTEGVVQHAENCNVAVYNCEFQTKGAETNDSIVFKTADELLNYTKSEEENMEKIVKEIVDSGVKCIITGGAISNMAIHYLDKYGIMALRTMSKFELRRIAKSVGATLLVRLGAPTKEEMGYADEIKVTEISSQKCILIRKESENNKLSTIVLRGNTNDMLDNLERVVNCGVNAYRAVCKSPLFVAGAGAIDMYLAEQIKQYASTVKTLDQYAIEAFGEAFDVIPRTILENSGYNVNEKLPTLRAKNNKNPNMGINIENGEIEDAFEIGVYDHLETKRWAIKHAYNAIKTIIKIDQIIVAKPAGGPKMGPDNPMAKKQKLEEEEF
ncbi:MAG: T-complex protein 1 subunit theta [Alphaproteobacteria bacterium]|nr:T-complex protein 1 subunit theta [Alphaproteobacteria bacterium]